MTQRTSSTLLNQPAHGCRSQAPRLKPGPMRVRPAVAVLLVCAMGSTAGCGFSSARSVPSGRYIDDPAACVERRLPPAVFTAALTPGTQLIAARACYDNGGTGLISGRATLHQLSALAAALSLPSAQAREVCDASGTIPIAFTVELTDLQWVHPPIPSDGCHPREQTLAVLRAIAHTR